MKFLNIFKENGKYSALRAFFLLMTVLIAFSVSHFILDFSSPSGLKKVHLLFILIFFYFSLTSILGYSQKKNRLGRMKIVLIVSLFSVAFSLFLGATAGYVIGFFFAGFFSSFFFTFLVQLRCYSFWFKRIFLASIPISVTAFFFSWILENQFLPKWIPGEIILIVLPFIFSGISLLFFVLIGFPTFLFFLVNGSKNC